MGSRGAFVDVDKGNFSFKDDGQNYYSIGSLSSDENVKILVQDKGSVKAPEYSHTAGRVYAVVQGGKIKHLTFYGDDHRQCMSIDFGKPHKGMVPHKHYNLDHSTAFPLSDEDKMLIAKIRKEYKI